MSQGSITLRQRFAQRQAQGSHFNLSELVGLVVPLCVDLADRHSRGERLFLHPSCILVDDDGRYRFDALESTEPPRTPGDLACLAPEQRQSFPGDARASVFAIGAIAYEALTGQQVGPGMERPSLINAAVTPDVEGVLTKALVADPAHRPADLLALAQAMHHFAPRGSAPPPDADASHLDLDVDVSLSMLPPPGGLPSIAATPFARPIIAAPASRRDDKTEQLTDLRTRLEADPRPRYVVVKDGMDHGPFNAVELLQQIGSHQFTEDMVLRDMLGGHAQPIREWPEFATFAEQARLHRGIQAEKAAIERVVISERKSTRGKAFLGAIAVAVLVGGAALWYLAARGTRSDTVAVQGNDVTNIETDATLGKKKVSGGGRGRGGVVGRAGGFPQLAGGVSCEAAAAAYQEDYNLAAGGQKVPADLTAGYYSSVLDRGTYLSACGVPSSMAVNICAAIQNGKAVGVTVTTSPANGSIAGCIAGQIRAMSFKPHPRLDVTRTRFAP